MTEVTVDPAALAHSEYLWKMADRQDLPLSHEGSSAPARRFDPSQYRPDIDMTGDFQFEVGKTYPTRGGKLVTGHRQDGHQGVRVRAGRRHGAAARLPLLPLDGNLRPRPLPPEAPATANNLLLWRSWIPDSSARSRIPKSLPSASSAWKNGWNASSTRRARSRSFGTWTGWTRWASRRTRSAWARSSSGMSRARAPWNCEPGQA